MRTMSKVPNRGGLGGAVCAGRLMSKRITSMQAEKIISMSRAAELAGLAPYTLRRLVAIGRVPCVRVCGRRRVRLSQVLACLEECGV